MGRPDHALEVQEVFATIAQLPEDFRLALVAVDVLGLSYREAARALHVREATITTRLFRARKQVGKRLASEEPGGQQGAGAGKDAATTPHTIDPERPASPHSQRVIGSPGGKGAPTTESSSLGPTQTIMSKP
jgi:predicted DNA-binding protein (UPF0251 family)